MRLPEVAASTQNGAPDTHVCRPRCDRRFEVATHPRRDPAGLRVRLRDPCADACQPRESERSQVIGRHGSVAEGGDAHDPQQLQSLAGRDLVGQRQDVRRRGSAARAVPVQAHLHQSADPTTTVDGGAIQGVDQPGPVDRVHDVCLLYTSPSPRD